MNFQRGLAPTEAMGVGQVAIAPVIRRFYELDPSNMRVGKDGKAYPAKMEIISPHNTLESIQENKIKRNLRFYAFITGEELDAWGDEVMHRLSEYKGLYVKYGDKTYKIPK
jgi:hypothetical protein